MRRVAAALCGVLMVGLCHGVVAAQPRLLAMPIVPQAQTWSCGAASLLSVLYYMTRYDAGEASLYEALGTTPENGTRPERIVEVARKQGLAADLRQFVTLADLAAALRRKDTAVILDIQAWPDDPVRWEDDWEDGHYVVLVGMDARHVYVMDPSSYYTYGFIPRTELPRRWHDYETVDGKRVEYHQAAIFIRGTPKLHRYPGVERVE